MRETVQPVKKVQLNYIYDIIYYFKKLFIDSREIYLVSPHVTKKLQSIDKSNKTWYNRSAREKAENEEKACTLEDAMYKFKREKQISFTDFNQPLGLQMNPDNRWIKKAAM
ncbi:MAG: hypothetical protein K5695_02065, partial [Oscillospiraceae bacterium]|nr:hypothetical protein [Oscillospiraceae bacterium]